MTLLSLLAIGFGFASAVAMAIPILKPKPILISPNPITEFAEEFRRSIINEVPILGGLQALEQAISRFHTDLWNAFVEQRNYTMIGLLLLVASMVFQLLQ
jgi:hypothetical protein